MQAAFRPRAGMISPVASYQSIASWLALKMNVDEQLVAYAQAAGLLTGAWNRCATDVVSRDGQTLAITADQQLIVMQRVSDAPGGPST